MSERKFLTAEWRKLIMANYTADPALLQRYVPYRTELDAWNGNHYISLVGFMFQNVRVKGFKIPFHTCFPEVNLRIYVRYKTNNEWKRGVVFIKEIVPLPAISFVANIVYKEHYITRKMKHHFVMENEKQSVLYQWKNKGKWNKLSVMANRNSQPIAEKSMEEFITEHYWGYSAMTRNKTGEYHVTHPRWMVYPVQSFAVDCDFASVYGNEFGWLNEQQPVSVLLAEGSEIAVYPKQII